MSTVGRVLVAALLAACGGGGGAPDGAPADAEVARTDLVPAVGSDATLDVACWNLRAFPSAAASPRLVGDLIASMQLDVVAVEEIDDQAGLDAVLARMPGWQAALPDGAGAATGGIGILWRTAAASVTDVELETSTDPRFPRPVVRAVVTSAVADTPSPLALHVVHFKAGTSNADEQVRVDQAAWIEANVRDRIDASGIDRLLVLGDFNEDSSDPRAGEVFAPWTGAPDRYTVPSLPLDDGGAVTFLPAGVMLDHLVATRALDPALTEPPLIPPLDGQLAGYQATVSDHLPLVLRLQPAP